MITYPLQLSETSILEQNKKIYVADVFCVNEYTIV